MATAETLQYLPQAAGRSGISAWPLSPAHSNPTSPQSFFSDFYPQANIAAVQSQWSTPAYTGDTYSSQITPANTTPKSIAANSSHGKLHKRATAKQPRGKNKHDDSQGTCDNALVRTRTPPASAGASPVDGPKSPSIKSATRGILKQNLRKFSHYHEDSDPENTIDLSRTAEELSLIHI